jgi:hypothetical protein
MSTHTGTSKQKGVDVGEAKQVLPQPESGIPKD